MRPTRYYVEYLENPTAEPDLWGYSVRNFDSLPRARRFMAALDLHRLPQLRERQNIRDVTPVGDPRGLLWDYDDELVEEPA